MFRSAKARRIALKLFAIGRLPPFSKSAIVETPTPAALASSAWDHCSIALAARTSADVNSISIPDLNEFH